MAATAAGALLATALGASAGMDAAYAIPAFYRLGPLQGRTIDPGKATIVVERVAPPLWSPRDDIR